jgi:hypothetical protein
MTNIARGRTECGRLLVPEEQLLNEVLDNLKGEYE